MLAGIKFVSKEQLQKKRAAAAQRADARATAEAEQTARAEGERRKRQEKGDDRWINPALAARLDGLAAPPQRDERDGRDEGRKRKHHKKEKKEKREKKERKERKSKKSKRAAEEAGEKRAEFDFSDLQSADLRSQRSLAARAVEAALAAHSDSSSNDEGGDDAGSDADDWGSALLNRRQAPPSPSGSGSGSDMDEGEAPPPPPADDNQSAAAKLRARLQAARSSAPAVAPLPTAEPPPGTQPAARAAGAAPAGRAEQVVVVTPLDTEGRRIDVIGAAGARREEDMTVEELLRRERSDQGMDANFAKNVMRLGSRYAGRETEGDGDATGFDEEATVDASMYANPLDRLDAQQRQDKLRGEAAAATAAWERIARNCPHCLENPKFPKHLLIAMGNHSFLMLASWHRLVDGHCYIVPRVHVSATTECDEDVYAELQQFKSALVKMHAANNRGVLFLETATRLHQRKHVLVHALPVRRRVEGDAPLYFRQALTNADEEWATHPKVIDTTEKGLRRSVPPKFPYLHIEWGASGGYAHVVEDEALVAKDFLLDTVAGMLGIPPGAFGRRAKAAFEEEKAMVSSFARRWSAYDWTAYLPSSSSSAASS